MCKRILTKGDLCYIFGLYNRKSGVTYSQKLRKKYFTDEALGAMNISLERFRYVRCGRPFSYEESQRIIKYFQIEKHELEETCS